MRDVASRIHSASRCELRLAQGGITQRRHRKRNRPAATTPRAIITICTRLGDLAPGLYQLTWELRGHEPTRDGSRRSAAFRVRKELGLVPGDAQ